MTTIDPADPPDVITEAGVYYGLPATTYHNQRDWLSWSQMKHLIPPSTPAHFKAAMAAGEEHKRHFDLGKVVHRLVLGDGDAFEVVQALDRAKNPYDALDYHLISAQKHRDAIYAEGRVPILAHELEQAEAMAEAIREHETASHLFRDGNPEVSLFWVDPITGVKCRARVDWLPDPVSGRRMIVPDLKTAAMAAPSEFGRVAAKFGYYGQACHYLDGVTALGLDRDPAFLFCVVEKDDPYEVVVGQFAKREDIRLARATVDHCRRLFADCVKADTWPGYPRGVNQLELPQWFHYQMEDMLP